MTTFTTQDKENAQGVEYVIKGVTGASYTYVDTRPPDMVNKPPHYTVGGIETIDFIEAKKLNYNLGNAIKYIARCLYKGTKKQDLEKAIYYLKREIQNDN